MSDFLIFANLMIISSCNINVLNVIFLIGGISLMLTDLLCFLFYSLPRHIMHPFFVVAATVVCSAIGLSLLIHVLCSSSSYAFYF